MPLAWKIARLEQMVVCTSEGFVTLPDIQSYFRALDEAGAFPYQKIFLATAGVSVLSPDDIRTVAGELQSRRRTGHFGEIAVVAGVARNNRLTDIFRLLSQVDRPCTCVRPSMTPASGSPETGLRAPWATLISRTLPEKRQLTRTENVATSGRTRQTLAWSRSPHSQSSSCHAPCHRETASIVHRRRCSQDRPRGERARLRLSDCAQKLRDLVTTARQAPGRPERSMQPRIMLGRPNGRLLQIQRCKERTGPKGRRDFNAYETPNKTLETKTLDAGRRPTEFSGRAGNGDETLDTGVSNVVTTTPARPSAHRDHRRQRARGAHDAFSTDNNQRPGLRMPALPPRPLGTVERFDAGWRAAGNGPARRTPSDDHAADVAGRSVRRRQVGRHDAISNDA